MHPAALAATRRFPLLGRPRPACPALALRIQEITDAVEDAARKADHGIPDAAHALNKAALIASDCGLPHLAEDLCWQHIDAYRTIQQPLTVLEARYMLEPVLNLARLQIRANQTADALHLLETMYQAISQRHNLAIGDRSLPTATLVGEQPERHQLREWVWLQLIGEGVRALALAGRWTDAAAHARTYNGIGVHLMEGRQAAIIAACTQGDLGQSRTLLAQSTPTQPWEREIATCLHLMCTQRPDSLMERLLTAAVAQVTTRTAGAGYASYRARLGLTIATLAAPTRPDLATTVLSRIADEAIDSEDGYAARDVLGFHEPIDGITAHQHDQLIHRAAEAGLGSAQPMESITQRLITVADDAAALLDAAHHRSKQGKADQSACPRFND